MNKDILTEMYVIYGLACSGAQIIIFTTGGLKWCLTVHCVLVCEGASARGNLIEANDRQTATLSSLRYLGLHLPSVLLLPSTYSEVIEITFYR